MKGLTEKQQSMLDFIEDFIQREAMPPTVYEIADGFGIKTATAFAHVRALQRKGYVSRSSKARSLTLVRSTKPKHLSLTLSVPVLGRISAGLPLFAEQNIEDTIQVDPVSLPRGIGGHRLFALRVRGESMRDLGIRDNDLLIAKEQLTAQISNIVIALVEDEATVKSLYLNEGKIELRPANPDFKSQFYNPDQVTIQGIVVSLLRTY